MSSAPPPGSEQEWLTAQAPLPRSPAERAREAWSHYAPNDPVTVAYDGVEHAAYFWRWPAGTLLAKCTSERGGKGGGWMVSPDQVRHGHPAGAAKKRGKR